MSSIESLKRDFESVHRRKGWRVGLLIDASVEIDGKVIDAAVHGSGPVHLLVLDGTAELVVDGEETVTKTGMQGQLMEVGSQDTFALRPGVSGSLELLYARPPRPRH
jgi:hypothetical protein